MIKKIFLIASFLFFAASAHSFSPAIVSGGATAGAGGGDSALYTAATEIWDFDNDGTAVKDAGHNLSVGNGDPSYTATGPEGSTHYLNLDGDDSLTLADDAHFDVGAADYTWSFWVNFQVLTDCGMLGKGNNGNPGGGYSIRTDFIATDHFMELVNIDTWTASEVTTDFQQDTTSQWYHVVVAYDDDAADEYTVWVSTDDGAFGDEVNGTQYNQDTVPLANAFALFFGYEEDTGAYHTGYLDEAVFWNGKALDATEAEAIYDGNWR